MDSDAESEHSDLNYRSLDDFMVSVSSKDTNVRLDVYARLEDYLNNENSCLKCQDLNRFTEAVLQWVHSSNYRISINGLTLIQLLIQRLTDQLKNQSIEIVSSVVDRLSDSKEQVRMASKNILIFMMASYTPMHIWDKLQNSFNHKLAKVKEELLYLLEDTLHKFGASGLQLNKIVTHIVKLLSDANQAVRDKSLESLVEIYRHVGERLRLDLKKKLVPEAKLKLIFHKFDEAARNGELKEEAKSNQSNKQSDHADTGSSSCASLPPSSHLKPPSKMIPASRSNIHSIAGSASRPGTAPGGVDEDTFLNAFENVPKIQIYSERDVNQYMVQINECLADPNNDWEKRVDSLKRLRSLAIAASQNDYEEEFFLALKQITNSFCLQIKDLRSQIVREACISIAFLSTTIGARLEKFCEDAMTHLINLMQNSAKVMALSGVVAIRFIIENTHSTRLIPLITGGVASRSKEIRRNCMDFIRQFLETWDSHHLDKHTNLITSTIKKGLGDADPEARVFSRKAFWAFSSHNSSAADHLLNSLDAKTQKLLQNGSKGAFGSVKSLKDGFSASQNSYQSANTFNYDFMDSQNGRTKATPTKNTQSTPSARIKRSTSAVDIKNSRSNSVISSGYGKSAMNDSFNKSQQNTSRIPMSNLNTSAVKGTPRIALSQPGSRSTSPTPKYSYLTHTQGTPSKYNQMDNSENNGDLAMTPNGYGNKSNLPGSRSANTSFSKSKIPTSSRNSSRESSPGRRSNYGSERRSSLSKGLGTPGRRLFGRQLTNNSESEHALTSALHKYRGNRRWDDSDDASETSSICSERSFSSSIGGTRITEDMNEAITCLSSSQWSDRRDGLVNLKNMMQCNRIFSRQELKRLCEIFTRLFSDQHVKVCTLFLDILNDFIRVYKRDLREWLYTLLTKLLTKLGTESLSSIYQKLCICLEATRSSFDLDMQFKILIQFIKDNTNQSSNLKVKIAVLKYLQDIICLMESVDFHASDDLKYAVCKIVSLTAEPKSVEVRKTSQAVLVALFNLNTPEFSLLLQELPKNIQEAGSKILRNHIKNFSQEHNGTNSYSSTTYSSSEYKLKSGGNYFNEDSLNSGSQFSCVVKNIQSLNLNSGFDYSTLNSKKDLNIKGIDTLSKDSGVQSNGDVDSDSDGAMTSSSTTTTSSASALPNINQLISSLSNNNGASISNTDRLKYLRDLTELIKTGNRPECKWNENFKNILFCLFNHLDYSANESNDQLAIQTMLALRELLQFQYKEFSNYIELTILKLIEKYKESPPNELSKLVEEVICTAARCLPPEPCTRVLKPLIETAEYPKNLMAIRMMQKTIDQMNPELCNRLLPDILNCLLIAWDSTHSPVRKAAVFCLVSLYMVIGEDLRNHLTNLSSSKVKLLNVYINRAKEGTPSSHTHQITA